MPFIAIILEGLLLSGSRLRAQEWQPASADHGRLAIIEGLPVAVVSGSPGDIGTAEGVLFHDRVQSLLGLMRVHPRLILARPTARFKATLASIGTEDVDRLTALGIAAKVKPDTLIEANALVDAQCSAVVCLAHGDEPLRVARYPSGTPHLQHHEPAMMAECPPASSRSSSVLLLAEVVAVGGG